MARGGKKRGRAASGEEGDAEKASDAEDRHGEAVQAASSRAGAASQIAAYASSSSAAPAGSNVNSAGSSSVCDKRQMELREGPAPCSEPAAAAPAHQQQPAPRAASDFSALERLPDELLKRVVGFLGLREAWGVCRLPLVSRRMREVLAATEFDALVLRGQRIGLSRYRDLPEAELRSWARRVRSGALRIAAGGAVELDMYVWRTEDAEPGSTAHTISSSFWMPEPARPFLSFASSLQGLRRFVAWHGDVVPSTEGESRETRANARHAYAGALLAALAPVAGTLEELSVRLQTDEQRNLPQGAAREAIAAGLRRLTALRSLDLAGCVGFSAELLDEVAPALGGLRSLRIAHCDPDGSLPPDQATASRVAFAAAVERLCPDLEELRATFGGARPWGNAGEALCDSVVVPLCRLPRLRALSLHVSHLLALPEIASPRLEELEIEADTLGMYYGSSSLLADVASIESLRTLVLVGDFQDWHTLATTAQIRSLSLGPCEPYDECFAVVARLPALERFSVHFTSYTPARLTTSLAALAAALPSGPPSLRSLLLTFSFPGALPFRDAAFQVALTAVLRAAKDTLEEYDRDMVHPSVQESEALAACTRLRRASLTLAEPAAAAAASAERLAALAPLASMAARPAPAPGDLVLARGPGDESDWGAIRPLLGDRWRLE
eukprot:tig00020824_g14277.t1